MLPTFLAQFAAGCLLVAALSTPTKVGWKYQRLVAGVSFALSILALYFLWKENPRAPLNARDLGFHALVASLFVTLAWFLTSTTQRELIGNWQRAMPAFAGASALVSAVTLVLKPDPLLNISEVSRTGFAAAAASGTTILGALLLGSATTAMLLGHRYLTDTNLSILPLRRLARVFLAVVTLRALWVAALGFSVWTGAYQPGGDYIWFWLMICVRVGVGVVGVGVFAWMVWDCVKRRATQSATAIFYLAMIFVFLGELAGQYLTRMERLAL